MQSSQPVRSLPRTSAGDHHQAIFPVPAGAKSGGITDRDWLAALAMQGILMHGMKVSADRALTDEQKDDQLAERAYEVADAMVRVRDRAKESPAERA